MRVSQALTRADGILGETSRVEEMEFVEQRRDGSKTPVDSGIGATGPVLVLHEGDTISSGDGLRRFGDHFEEDFQVVSVADPCVVCPAHPDQVEEVVDERSVGGDVGYLAFLSSESEADSWFDGCARSHLQISCHRYLLSNISFGGGNVKLILHINHDDVEVTRQLVSAGKLMDIEVLDHLVIGQQKYVSLRERGLGFS